MSNSLPTHVIPSPSAPAVSGAKRVIERLGGKVHQAAHSDRISRPISPPGSQALELCTCNQAALADIPQPGAKPAARICIVCDAVTRWPRVLREAVSA